LTANIVHGICTVALRPKVITTEPTFATMYIEWNNNPISFFNFGNSISYLLDYTSEFVSKRLAWFHTLEISMKQVQV
jgi:hypothetical protein